MVTVLHKTQALLHRLQRLAESRLGTSCTPFELDWCLWSALHKAAPRPQTFGMTDAPALRSWVYGSDGHDLKFGGELFRVPVDGRHIPVILFRYPQQLGNRCSNQAIWFCPTDAYRVLYRFLRRAASHDESVAPPLMIEEDRQRLWDNTVGFLLKAQELWQSFQIPVRRGVMLIGEPGNGKTMAARWLRAQASKHNFDWKTITGEDYDKARAQGELSELLSLSDPGLIFLDDFDRGLESREHVGATRDHAALLSALDGMDTPQGVVYVFTSNLTWSQLDPAIRRPGRIDSFVAFSKPTATLRRRFFVECWPEVIRAAVPLDAAVAATEGMSYAEIDELRKLMALRFVETGTWDWSTAWDQYRARTTVADPRGPIGFAAAAFPAPRTDATALPPATKLATDAKP